MPDASTEDATEALIAHVRAGESARIAPATLTAAKTFILDTLGVALSGSRVPTLATLRSVTAPWGSGAAARVWTTGERVPAATAAFLNGYQIHNQEWDCLHEPAVVHPMAVVLATLIAWSESRAEARMVSGADLIRACSIAVDVATSLGMCARDTLRFFRPAICGALGATAGLASLLRFEAREIRAALGSCYSQVSGTMQAHVEGSPLLPLQIGFNARAALTAIELTEHGILGPVDALQGPFGFFALIERDADLTPLLTISAQSRLTELSHKPFPSGRATHGGVDGLLTLAAEHRFSPHDVREVRVFAPPLVLQLVDRAPSPDMTASYARLCLPYVAATALLTGTVSVEDFEPPAISSPSRQALATRVRVLPNGAISRNALAPQRVEVDLVDGRHLSCGLPAVLGAPAHPLSREQHLQKFERACASSARPPSARVRRALIDCVETLESLRDVRQLVDLLVTT